MRPVLLALLALGLSACCAVTTDTVRSSFVIDPADPARATLVADCFANDLACERLCIDLLGPPPIGWQRTVTECNATRRPDGMLAVEATSNLVSECDLGYGDGWDWTPTPDAAPDAEVVVDGGVIGDAAPATDAAPAADAGP